MLLGGVIRTTQDWIVGKVDKAGETSQLTLVWYVFARVSRATLQICGSTSGAYFPVIAVCLSSRLARERAAAEWGWLLDAFGYRPFQNWATGHRGLA